MQSHFSELRAYCRTLTADQCEEALAVLNRHFEGPHCPVCREDDMDRLEWQQDETHVVCTMCGHAWEYGVGAALAR